MKKLIFLTIAVLMALAPTSSAIAYDELTEKLINEIVSFSICFDRLEDGENYWCDYEFSIPVVNGDYDGICDGLLVGDYKINVEALDEKRVVLLKGSSLITIEQSAIVLCTVPLEGSGHYQVEFELILPPGVQPSPQGHMDFQLNFGGKAYYPYSKGSGDNGELILNMTLPTNSQDDAPTLIIQGNEIYNFNLPTINTNDAILNYDGIINLDLSNAFIETGSVQVEFVIDEPEPISVWLSPDTPQSNILTAGSTNNLVLEFYIEAAEDQILKAVLVTRKGMSQDEDLKDIKVCIDNVVVIESPNILLNGEALFDEGQLFIDAGKTIKLNIKTDVNYHATTGNTFSLEVTGLQFINYKTEEVTELYPHIQGNTFTIAQLPNGGGGSGGRGGATRTQCLE